ncbi:MAG: ATP-dependent protease, Lon family [Firmicutes bacterium]|nr:ATP-dependent protease, Lon family [Bacillota bacterium]
MKESHTLIFAETEEEPSGRARYQRQITILFGLLTNLYGRDKLIQKAKDYNALQLMRTGQPAQRLLALQRLAFEDESLGELPSEKDFPQILAEIEETIADLLARRAVEGQLEERVALKVQEQHERYLEDIKMQILKKETGVENAATLKKYAVLEKMEQVGLSVSAREVLRPRHLGELVGQAQALEALLTKIASPFPQHVILYGPPGVGKTTAARLSLAEAQKRRYTPFRQGAPFVEVDGTTLRWDPREITNPLLGSVHDPIYQGARRDFAEGGVPEPKLGLVSDAHGGVLFIDEIGEIDPMLQGKLLKVLEDKRVTFDSSYYDPDDPRVPKYIKKLFKEGAPADFILIGATTRSPEEINPAIRSRCAEVFFSPLTTGDIRKIVREAAERLGVRITRPAVELISASTIEARQAVNVLADAYGLTLQQRWEKGKSHVIGINQARRVLQMRRLSPLTAKASPRPEVGRAFGLGVNRFLGLVLEVEAAAFPALEEGQGRIRFNDTAGSMAKDSVFNAAAVIRRISGEEIGNYDLHVNVIGGAQVDGPSAGAVIFLALYSAIKNRALRQDVAVSGEISIQGRVKEVGGIPEKIYGARQAGMKKIILPRENKDHIPPDNGGVEVVLVDTVEEILEHVWAEEE